MADRGGMGEAVISGLLATSAQLKASSTEAASCTKKY